MSVLRVPVDEKNLLPTLGQQVCDWIEANLCFGPGDLRGEPVRLDSEKMALIYALYAVFPRGHRLEGRRRFQRAGISLAKGMGKTELAAWISAAELHPEAPVRFGGFDRYGRPEEGRSVTDPYIPLVAYTEEQSDELCYGALKAILEESPAGDAFDIGLERIVRKTGDGKAVSLSSSPSARDGARTTFCVADETHWWTLPRLHEAHRTMLQNLAKRKIAEPWMLEITTAYEPGAGSIAEATMDRARAMADGRLPAESKFFFFHRQASEHDLKTEKGARAAVIEASGAAAEWRDIEAALESWRDPQTGMDYWERIWGNRPTQSNRRAFDAEAWRGLSAENTVQDGDEITLGFDGAVFHDATGIVATHVKTGFQWVAGLWECPFGAENWKVPEADVDDTVRGLFGRYRVLRMYADPPYWQVWVAKWAGEHGEKAVVEWYTNRRKPMSYALESFDTAIKSGSVSHDGNPDLRRHVANALKREIGERDEQGKRLWLIEKERFDSPHKIDLVMAAVLSWEARSDVIASGALAEAPTYRVTII